MPPDLGGRVAVVAGATRAAGRATAVELGAAGATVYATGRSTRAEASPAQVAALAERVRDEQDGRLDLLVNDVWGGDPLTEWVPFWEHSLENGLRMQQLAVHTHLVTSWHLAPLMVERGRGLIVEVTDGESERYRGSLFYDLAKASVIRIAKAKAEDLREHGVAALAVTPGFLRSEAVLDHFGVSAETWRDAIEKDPHFAASETPHFVGRAIAALAADPDVLDRSGGVFTSWGLAKEYGFDDVDGARPDWGAHFREHVAGSG